MSSPSLLSATLTGAHSIAAHTASSMCLTPFCSTFKIGNPTEIWIMLQTSCFYESRTSWRTRRRYPRDPPKQRKSSPSQSTDGCPRRDEKPPSTHWCSNTMSASLPLGRTPRNRQRDVHHTRTHRVAIHELPFDHRRGMRVNVILPVYDDCLVENQTQATS